MQATHAAMCEINDLVTSSAETRWPTPFLSCMWAPLCTTSPCKSGVRAC